MFDAHDPSFQATRDVPRLGPPVLDASGRVTFISDARFVFDKHHAAFQQTGAVSRFLPPVDRDGLIQISIR
jgi:hypothetical protein